MPQLINIRILSVLLVLLPVSAHADTFMGPWARGDGVVRATIAPCGSKLCMTDTWIKPGVADEKVGDKVVFDVKPQADGTLKGSGFDPQRNLKFSVVLTVVGDRMTTSGCGFGGLVCKSQDWTRIR